MQYEFSAGVVVYMQHEFERRYLLLHYQAGHWDFPKGHVEPNETHKEAALRELFEETGIKDVLLNANFFEKFSYFLQAKKTNALIRKTVYFFIGSTTQEKISLSHEHIGYAWLNYKEAAAKLTYQNAKKFLTQVDAFLNS